MSDDNTITINVNDDGDSRSIPDGTSTSKTIATRPAMSSLSALASRVASRGGANAAAGTAGASAATGVGITIAALIAVGTALAALKRLSEQVSEQVSDTAKEVAPYSSQVSAAVARNAMKRIELQLNRDAQIGEQLARHVDLQGDISRQLKDIKTELLQVGLPILQAILKAIVAVLGVFKDVVRETRQFYENVKQELTLFVTFTKGEEAHRRRKEQRDRHAEEDARDKGRGGPLTEMNRQIAEFFGLPGAKQ